MAANNQFSTFLAGKIGYVAIYDEDTQNTTFYPFAKWSFPMKEEFIKRNNFNSLGYQDGVGGFQSVAPTLSGPWAGGFPPLANGGWYWIYLGLTSDGPLEYGAYVHFSEITPDNDAEQAPNLEIKCDSVGQFTALTQ